MYYFIQIVGILVSITANTKGQAGNSYTCVPSGYCNNGGSSSPGIDPRIVTPTQTPGTPGTPSPGQPCPANLIPCYTQGPTSICGNRYVSQTNFQDGPAQPAVYPWQAYLRNSTNLHAGSGVLIDNNHVLTAAHKVYLSQANPGSVTVYMGVYNPSDIGTNPQVQSRTVSQIIIAPGFNSGTLMNDLAILRVSQPFSLSQNNINTACLPAAGVPGSNPYLGQNCVVAGWGQTSFPVNDSPTTPMKQVFLSITDYNTCRTSFSNPAVLGTNVDAYLDPNGEICAGGQTMKDACTNDGGAPLICPASGGKATIAGLVIWGKNCGQPGVYGVYVSLPSYRTWIDQQVQPFNAIG